MESSLELLAPTSTTSLFHVSTEKIINISIGKIMEKRAKKSGMRLHDSLAITSILKKAKDLYFGGHMTVSLEALTKPRAPPPPPPSSQVPEPEPTAPTAPPPPPPNLREEAMKKRAVFSSRKRTRKIASSSSASASRVLLLVAARQHQASLEQHDKDHDNDVHEQDEVKPDGPQAVVGQLIRDFNDLSTTKKAKILAAAPEENGGGGCGSEDDGAGGSIAVVQQAVPVHA